MSATIREYLSLPSSARVDSPNQTQQWLETLLAGGLNALGSVSDSIRSKLVAAILNDLSAASGTRQGDYLLNARSNVRWTPPIRLSALRLLKELSRLPGGSTPLSTPEGFRVLLEQVDFPKQRVRRTSLSKPVSSSSSSLGVPSSYSLGSIAKTIRRAVSRTASHQSTRDNLSSDDSNEEYQMSSEPDWAITDMALRCLNNALFLNENARLPFSSEEVGGGHIAVALLARPLDTPADILFLAARLLFFSTLFEAPFNKTAVTTLEVVHVEALCVDALVKAIRDKAADRNAAGSVLVASGSEAQLNTALSDLLKAHFNICLYYPRIVEAEAKQQQQQAQAASSSNGQARETKRDSKAILGEAFDVKLLEMLRPLVSIITSLPLASPVALMPPVTHAVAALLNYPVAEVKKAIATSKTESASPSSLTAPISPSSTAALQATPLYIVRLLTFADLMLARYLSAQLAEGDGRKVPEDVDAKAVKQKATADGIDLEDTLEPLILLLRKIAAEDDELRCTLKSILMPSDLDRSLALDRRIDVLGRLIRLMSSVTLPRLARASGEFLLSLHDGEAKLMTEAIGYGPCAGFLMSTGLASALPTSAHTAADGRSIDPITGDYAPSAEERAMDEINAMTEEEKEAEAERLFVLFDRLNRTGVVQVQHPMQTAQEQGRFEEIQERSEQDEKARREKEEQDLEKEVEREMAAHKKCKDEARLRAQKLAGLDKKDAEAEDEPTLDT